MQLELACGTGQWTPRPAERAHSVTAVDAAAEVLTLARARTASPTVQFLEADLFEWQPPRRYDTVFFAFWLSHVPPTRLPDFWNTVAAALAPGGKVIFIDDGPAVSAYEEVLTGQPTPAALRRLDDGSQYRIVKEFHDAQTLTDDLTALGWSVRIRLHGRTLHRHCRTADQPWRRRRDRGSILSRAVKMPCPRSASRAGCSARERVVRSRQCVSATGCASAGRWAEVGQQFSPLTAPETRTCSHTPRSESRRSSPRR
ncbi:class I SAM-dependent methyltransferase [Streptomyces sp. NPDC005071]